MFTPATPISRTISILKVHSRLKAFCLSVVGSQTEYDFTKLCRRVALYFHLLHVVILNKINKK